jgi:hypothetical protein
LTNKPDALPKISRISAMVAISSLTGLTKRATSSAYILHRNLTALLLNGENNPSSVAISKRRCSGSMASINNMGERGSPLPESSTMSVPLASCPIEKNSSGARCKKSINPSTPSQAKTQIFKHLQKEIPPDTVKSFCYVQFEENGIFFPLMQSTN